MIYIIIVIISWKAELLLLLLNEHDGLFQPFLCTHNLFILDYIS